MSNTKWREIIKDQIGRKTSTRTTLSDHYKRLDDMEFTYTRRRNNSGPGLFKPI